MNPLSTQEFKNQFLNENTSLIKDVILEDECLIYINPTNYNEDQKISIENTTFENGFGLHSEQQQIQGIVFISCIFKSSKKNNSALWFRNINIRSYIEFRDCNFEGNIDIKDLFGGRLWFDRIKCSNQINASNIKKCDLRFFNNSKELIKYENMSIHNVEKGVFSTYGIDIRTIRFSRVSTDKIFIGPANYKEIIFFSSSPQKIQINTFSDYPHIRIKKLSLNNLLNEGDITVKDALIDCIELNNLSNKGFFLFQNIVNSTDFQSRNSFFGDSVLSNIDFENTKIDLSNSFFENTKFSKVKWPKNLVLKPLKETDTQDYHQTQREVYRQLKQVYQNQGNNIEARVFYSHEMDAFQQELKYSNVLSFEDRIIVNTNAVFNNFGRSWVKPILWMFLFHTLFWILIGFDSYTIVSLENHKWSSLIEGISKYFELLIPTHSFTLLSKPVHKLVDILMRISSSYFIYMVLNSGRKFRL